MEILLPLVMKVTKAMEGGGDLGTTMQVSYASPSRSEVQRHVSEMRKGKISTLSCRSKARDLLHVRPIPDPLTTSFLH
jgi:hypothetical protein